MRNHHLEAILTAGLVLFAAPSFAQDRLVDVNIGGGYTFASGEVRNHLGDGFNVDFGVTFNVSETIGIQAEYGFTALGEKNIRIPVSPTPKDVGTPTDFFADMNMQYGDLNLVFKPKSTGARPYVVAGVGIYYRPIKVTTPSVGYVPGYCDPWWYVCYPGGLVPTDQIVGERSSTDFGMDLGGGVDFALGDAARLYIEGRYHYIWGPTVNNPNASGPKKANGQFFPITVGFRF